MGPRISLRRILSLRPFRPPNFLRPFTQNTFNAPIRPQLPFLASLSRRPFARFITTETKQWVKSELWRAGKYTAFFWSSLICLGVMYFGIQQERMERQFPSPPVWPWSKRKDYRLAKWSEHDDMTGVFDWVRTGRAYRLLLLSLEEPNGEDAGLKERVEGGILVDGVGKTGYDISEKPEPWRRGYYEVLMGAARAAERLDGWVRDTKRNIGFPPHVVMGPSNPDPRPLPPGAPKPPHENDCVPAYPPPETYYMRALTTEGFSKKQRLDAALAYASWLDFKKTPKAALEMYQWALEIANSTLASGEPAVDLATGVINISSGPPSANLLTATTALAVHHALHKDLSAALPIFLSILRARRTLPDEPVTMRSTLISDEEDNGVWKSMTNIARSIVVSPPYPPQPDDGTESPFRGPMQRCEEAAVMAHVGEILYASKRSGKGKEDGLAWTREAVDLAEEQLRRKGIDKDAVSTCKQCLEVGLSNWMTMVTRMAKAEQEVKDNKAGSWLSFGSGPSDAVGRWESEEKVIRERMRRAGELFSVQAMG